jgi:hypothetical protein
LKRSTLCRLARLGAERVTPEAVRAAGAALDRGEEPVGKAADFARELRAFILFAEAQTIGGGELTEGVIEHVQRDGTMRVQPADLHRAGEVLADWHKRYGADRTP